MKSRVLLALSLTLTLGATACGGGGGKSASGATKAHGPISIWYSNNAQEVTWGKQTVAAWNSAHPSEKVSAQEIPAGKSSEEVIGAAITAGSEPCLIYNTSPASVPTFQHQGGLVALDDFPGAAQLHPGAHRLVGQGEPLVPEHTAEHGEEGNSAEGDEHRRRGQKRAPRGLFGKSILMEVRDGRVSSGSP